MEKILITGGAGFIGSAVIRHIIKNTNFDIVNIDKLTYAGNLESLPDVESNSRYSHEEIDICDSKELSRIFNSYKKNGLHKLIIISKKP